MGRILNGRENHQTEMQLNYAGKSELTDTEEGLAQYNLHIVNKIFHELGISKTEETLDLILEFGAGTGALAEIWRSSFDISPVCIEIDPQLFTLLGEKGFKTYRNLNEVTKSISYIYTSNVLEHIEDDTNALRDLYKYLPTGGKLAIYVPALPILFSNLDRYVGHFRRYKRKELIEKVTLAGFHVEKCYFNDSIGVIASLGIKFLGFKFKSGPSTRRSILLYDRCLYPISKLLDKAILKHLIGKNLFCFAVKMD